MESKTKVEWTKEEFQLYLFVYCVNADYKETKEELELVKSKIGDSTMYAKMRKEFEKDNDYISIQKIIKYIEMHNYVKGDADSLFAEMKEIFLSDGTYNILEKNLMLGLKKFLK
jgi:hypothetical protein